MLREAFELMLQHISRTLLAKRSVRRNCSGNLVLSGAHYLEPATPIISHCNGVFTDQSIFRYFSREKGQF